MCRDLNRQSQHRRKLVKLGEDVTETLEVIPRQPPAPFHPIARGCAGPELLAMILEAKFDPHLPLNRQSDRYVREGSSSTPRPLADW